MDTKVGIVYIVVNAYILLNRTESAWPRLPATTTATCVPP